MDLMQRLIARWTEHGIAIRSGASDADISNFESRFHCTMPADLRHYFETVNGMGELGTTDDDLFSFWRLSDVQSVAQYVPDRADRLPNASRYLIIADHSIGLPSFAIRISATPNAPSPVASLFTDRGALELEDTFDSFTGFLRSYLDDPNETSAAFPRGV